MKDTIFVIVNRVGFQRALKTATFDLKPGERAFKVAIEIPDEAFAPPLLPTVRMVIPRDSLITNIDAEVSVPVEGHGVALGVRGG